MMIRNLPLSVKRGQFRKDDPSSSIADREFQKVRKSVLERDKYSCQFCGFKALKLQEVHHLDDNHDNNNPDNLITTCSLCHATQHIWFSGMKQRGVIIFLSPEKYQIDQIALNRIVRSLWVAESGSDRALATAASNALERLYKHRHEAKKIIGTWECDILGDFLVNLDASLYKEREELLNGFLFLPLKTGFSKQFSYWKELVGSKTPTNQWASIAKQRSGKWFAGTEGDDVDIAKNLGIITN